MKTDFYISNCICDFMFELLLGTSAVNSRIIYGVLDKARYYAISNATNCTASNRTSRRFTAKLNKNFRV